MLTFIFLAAGAILIVAALWIAFAANQRKRSSQSGNAEVVRQQTGGGRPAVGRAPGVD